MIAFIVGDHLYLTIITANQEFELRITDRDLTDDDLYRKILHTFESFGIKRLLIFSRTLSNKQEEYVNRLRRNVLVVEYL